MRRAGAHLRQVEVDNGWGQDGAPIHGEVSLASLGEKLCDSGGREMARAAGAS